MQPTWIEIRLNSASALQNVYAEVDHFGCVSVHHFNFEPWHREGPVVRVCGYASSLNPLMQTVALQGTCVGWNPAADEKLFGDRWEAVSAFFEASSRLAVSRSPEWGPRYRRWTLSKEVHCMLNAQGLDVDDEFRFALRFAWGRARMWVRDAIKGRLNV